MNQIPDSMGFEFPSGVIVSSSPTTPAPASAISYTIRVNLPGGITLDFPNVKPAGTRWPDTLNTIPAPPGTPIAIALDGSQITFDVKELPELESCQ